MSTEDIVGSPPRGIVPCHNLYQYQLPAIGMGPVHMTGLEYLAQVQNRDSTLMVFRNQRRRRRNV